MDEGQRIQRLAVQRQIDGVSNTRNKISRKQLVFEHNLSRYDASQMHDTSAVSPLPPSHRPIPPSVTSLAELTEIQLAEPQLGQPFVGHYLIVRTLDVPFREGSSSTTIERNIVEDKASNVHRLVVYVSDPQSVVEFLLPNNTVFAIKNPHHIPWGLGGYAVLVGQPADLVLLPPGHPLMPDIFTPSPQKTSIDALASKDIGNAAFKNNDYVLALQAYTDGLNACKEGDDVFRQVLYRNRSLVYTYLERYEQAANDAITAIANDDGNENDTNSNVKALYRAGRAFYCLDDFSQAQSYFAKLVQIAPADVDGPKELARTVKRLEESKGGNYDFVAMKDAIKKGKKHLDHGSFTTNVEVRYCGDKGRGLFATKDIQAGELVLVEKAFATVFESDMVSKNNTGEGWEDSQAIIFWNILQKALRNQIQRQRLLKLFAGDQPPGPSFRNSDVDMSVSETGATNEPAAVDNLHVMAVFKHNCFDCSSGVSIDQTHTNKRSDFESVGLWIMASYFNHACDANALRNFLGDFIVVRATKFIPQGHEVTLAYRPPRIDYVETQETLQRIWNFRCNCAMCMAESKTSDTRRKERQDLVQKIKAFLDNNP